MVFKGCQKDGKQLENQHQKEGGNNTANVFVDEYSVVSAFPWQKECANLNAARVNRGDLNANSDNDAKQIYV